MAKMALRKDNMKKVFDVLKSWMFFSNGLKDFAAA
jgi:hypothetical protein